MVVIKDMGHIDEADKASYVKCIQCASSGDTEVELYDSDKKGYWTYHLLCTVFPYY